MRANGPPADSDQHRDPAADAKLTLHPPILAWSPTPGEVTVSWSAPDPGAWEVRVARDDRPEQVFGVGQSGSRTVDWIGRGSTFTFRLYRPGGIGHPVLTRSIRMSDPPPRPPFVAAFPNPVSPQEGAGRTTVAWDTGDGSDGVLVLVRRAPDGTESQQSLGTGADGMIHADWIVPHYVYRFRLYRATDRTRPIAATTVTMGSPTMEVLLDLAFVSVIGVLVALAGWGVSTAMRLLSRTAKGSGPRR